MTENIKIDVGSASPGKSRSRRRLFVNIILSLAVIGAGIAGAAYITKSAPKAQRRPPQKMIPLVQVVRVQPDTHEVIITAMGTVIPAREIVLESQVAGEIVFVNPEFSEGGFLKKGSEVLRIDPQDYSLALTLAQAKVKDAESKLKLLEEEAAAAKDEWRTLYQGRQKDDSEPPPLLIKEPQLSAAKAMLTAEKADVQKAKLNLSRTKIRTPFNAIVREKNVDIGSQVSGQEKLAELVGTDEYWIQASIPVERLSWIKIPRNSAELGSKVRVLYRNTDERAGRVIKLLGALETEGRMARILVEVQDPLGLNSAGNNQLPLLIGEYVRIEIEGRRLQNVYRIPRAALRDDANLWIVSNDGKLDIRKVDIVWRDTQTVLLREGLEPDERLIVSDLPSPIKGMPVQVAE
ncbi:MAG: efflux RND transporter periplasmic adaptor subunit [Desulfobacterales bacterium]|jgi:RND family efflux transporter MFP subunit